MLSALILDDDQDLRSLMSEVLLSLELDSCMELGSVDELRRLSEQELRQIALIFLDVNLGVDVPSGIDACHYLNEIQFTGQIYFFTAHAKTHPLVQAAIQTSAAQIEVLEKPVPFARFVEIVQNLRNQTHA